MSDSSIPPDPEDELTDADITAFLGSIPDTVPDQPVPEEFDEPPDKAPDEGENPFEEATTPIGDGACVVCGAPTWRPPGLTPTGRKKRVAKYCDLHDPKRRVTSDFTATANVDSQLAKIQDELADDLRLLGTLAGPLLPVTGYYVVENADPFVTAILKLAKNNQRVLRVLHRAAQVAPVYVVAETIAGTAYAIQVDQQKADPHSMVAHRLGVERAYDNVYPEQRNTVASTNGYQGPPRYVGVQ